MGPTASLFLCLIALAFSIPLDDHNAPTFRKMAARLEGKGLKFPEIPDRSDEEWIDLIKKARSGEPLGIFHEGNPEIILVNQTGAYDDTNGLKSVWNTSSTIYYYFEKDGIRRVTFDGYVVKTGEKETYLAYQSNTLFTSTAINGSDPVYDAAGVQLGASVKVIDDKIERLLNREYELMEGSVVDHEGTVSYSATTFSLFNVSDEFSVSENQLESEMKIGNASVTFKDVYFYNSIPLSPSFRLSRSSIDADTLIRVFRDLGDSLTGDISLTEGKGKGNLTIGMTGNFSSESVSMTQLASDETMVNSTASLKGLYVDVTNGTGVAIPVPFHYTLWDHVIKKLF